MEMRGLHNFIADIRKCANNRELEGKRINEELAKIKGKFKNSPSLSAYDKKKYVCKLMFIQMLGYSVNFGQMEGVELLSGKSQAEKLIGYLSVAVFLNENHELTPLVTHTVNLDLVSGKEFNMTLALAAISNIGGRDFAEVMSSTVQKVLSGSQQTTSSVVKKKALLTALRLYRKYPEVLSVETLLPIAIASLNTTDMGVMNCALSLITGLLKNQENCSIEVLQEFSRVPDCVVKIMNAIIGAAKITPIEYMYYGVPAPWIQMKCLKLLQYFPVPEDSKLRQQIMTILGKIVHLTTKKYKEAMQQERKKPLQSQAGAMIAVITELVGLIVQWDNDAQLLSDVTDLLSILIRNEKSPNYRYTGLKLMSRLSFCNQTTYQFDQRASTHQQQIVVALRDPDISIRRAALDVLYCMCSKTNADEIVGELLLLIPLVDRSFKQDLVLVVAIVAEKFCSDYNWYVEVILSVITHAGDEVAPDIWQRLCHVVVNTESVQKLAAETITRSLLSQTHTSQVLIQVASFVLGEFGYQIAISADCHPLQQFTALHSHFSTVDSGTKSMLLTTYVKFYNLYDNVAVRERIKKALESCLNSLDPEIQQRATEYLTLITEVSDSILQDCLEPMLPFTITTHSLLDRLTERQKGTDRNLWSEKAQQRDIDQINTTTEQRQRNAEASTITPPVPEDFSKAQPEQQAEPQVTTPQPKTSALDDIFEVTAPTVSPSSSKASQQTMETEYVPALLVEDSGVLFENPTIQVSVQPHQYRNADGRLNLVVKNLTSGDLSGVTSRLVKTSPHLIVQNKPHEAHIPAGQSISIMFAARATGVYENLPELQINWMKGDSESANATVVLPIGCTKFVAPYQLDDVSKFTALWASTPSDTFPEIGNPSPSKTSRNLVVSDLELLIFQKLKCQVLRGPGETVYGVGAHAVQPDANVQYTPVMIHLEISSNQVLSAVKTPNPALQKQLFDVLQHQLCSM